MNRRSILPTLLVLTVLPVVAFWGVWRNGFVYDDVHYILQNEHLQDGLTAESAAWAFTAIHVSNWHPLTWISHAVDVSLFGLRAEGHHAVNLAIHVVNGWLLFLALALMTGAPGRSAIVAALFAVHPLHVESVAWVAERKDVLSTFFMLLALIAYAWYVRRPGVGRYLLIALSFAFGLLSKPMVVTFPFLLLLLDYWPLRRFGDDDWRVRGPRLVLEKLPLLGLSAASSVVTVMAQKTHAMVAVSDGLSMAARASNAVVAYATYLVRTAWPRGLSVFYPHPGSGLPAWKVLLACAVLAGVTVSVIRRRRESPYLVVGWFWFLGTLVPVIGLVQVGWQGLADRYTYVPLTGVFVAVVWEVARLVRDSPIALRIARAGTVVILLVLTAVTFVQAGRWRDGKSLFGHALAVDPGNFIAHGSLGMILLEERRFDAAHDHLIRAVALKPDYVEAHYNLGVVGSRAGRPGDAVQAYRRCLELDPGHVQAHTNLAVLLAGSGLIDEAVRHFEAAVELEPGIPEGYINLGMALEHQRKWREAAERYRQALAIDPQHALARSRLSRLAPSR